MLIYRFFNIYYINKNTNNFIFYDNIPKISQLHLEHQPWQSPVETSSATTGLESRVEPDGQM